MRAWILRLIRGIVCVEGFQALFPDAVPSSCFQITVWLLDVWLRERRTNGAVVFKLCPQRPQGTAKLRL